MEKSNNFSREYWNKSLSDRIIPNGFRCNESKWYILNRILDKYDIRDLKKIELGCGCSHIARHRKWIIYTGIDISNIGIDYSRFSMPNERFICTPAENIELEETFDVILAMDSLEHISLTSKLVSVIKKLSHRYTFFLGNIPLIQVTTHPSEVEHKMSYNILSSFLTHCGFPHLYTESYYLPAIFKKSREKVFYPMLFFKATREDW